MLAPDRFTRLSGQATELSSGVWEITIGDAVPAWLLANAPPSVSRYNFLQLWGCKIDSMLVVRRPAAASSSAVQQNHDLADLFEPMDVGRQLARAKPNKEARRSPGPSEAHTSQDNSSRLRRR